MLTYGRSVDLIGTTCAECGLEASRPIPRLVATLADRFPATLSRMLFAGMPAELRRRPSPTVWSPLEYAAHAGAAVSWYLERIDRVLSGEFPQLLPFDWDEATDAARFNECAVEQVLIDVSMSCRALSERATAVDLTELRRAGMATEIVQVRDVPTHDVEVLRARAASRNVSLSSYLRELIHDDTSRSTMAEVLERIATRESVEADHDDIRSFIEDDRR